MIVGLTLHDYFHIHGDGGSGNLSACASETNQAQSAAFQPSTFFEQRFVPLALVQKFICLNDSPINADHQADGQLCNRIRMLAWTIRYENTKLGCIDRVNDIGRLTSNQDHLQIGTAIDQLGVDS